MTIAELSQLKHINREIERLKRRLDDLRSRPVETLGCVQGSVKTPPYNLHSITIEGEGDCYVLTEIGELRAEIAYQLRRCMQEQIKLERWIKEIPDSLLRQIFAYRYVNGLEWKEVAASLGVTENSVKVAHHRYLKSCNTCNAKMM